MTLRNVAFSKNQMRRETESQKEYELRQLLHNTIDVLDFEQLKKVKKMLNLKSEFGE